MYKFYLDMVLLPIPPAKLTLKIRNQNKTINLINESEVNLLKSAGLTQIEFKVLLSDTAYGFGFETKSVAVYLSKLEQLKVSRKPFQFIVLRPKTYDTNMTVSLEEYDIEEDAENGRDVVVSIQLKQYRQFGVKTIKLPEPAKPAEKPKETRSGTPAAPKTRTHKVVKGDCLWNIAIKFYGKGTLYTKIYEANKDKIKNPHWIYPNQILTIPL